MVYKNEVVCECGSKRVFKLRIDSDWSEGTGDYYPVNKEEYYNKKELKYDAFDRPDIEVFHCLDCQRLWE